MIDGGEAEAVYAHFALQRLHILPSVFNSLEQSEKAFVIASIQARIEAEKKQADKLKHK